MDNLIREVESLPLTDKLMVIEQISKSIRNEMEKSLENAVNDLYNEYKENHELTIFTQIDQELFYEAR